MNDLRAGHSQQRATEHDHLSVREWLCENGFQVTLAPESSGSVNVFHVEPRDATEASAIKLRFF
jgi:hypothetical protein